MQRYLLLVVGALVTIALDQWTKYLAWTSLAVGGLPADASDLRTRLHVVFESWFNLRLAGNKGAAWGLFRSLPDDWRVPFFVLISVVAVAVIVTLYRKAESLLHRLALTLIMGGAIGNLIDRIWHGYVIDFIDWHYKNQWHWPTFNIADIGISVGVGLLLLDMLLAKKKGRAEEAARIAPEK